MKVCGVILAGGLSRRMGGREKSLIKLGGTGLLDRVIGRLGAQLDEIVINANGDPERFAGTKLPVIADPIEGFAGPLAGVLAGMNWAFASGRYTHVATIAADTPFFPGNLIEQFKASTEPDDPETIVLASTEGRLHPVFGLWPVGLRDDLQNFLELGETRKVLAFVDRHGLIDCPFDDLASETGYDPFFNINTEEDLALAEEILGALTS